MSPNALHTENRQLREKVQQLTARIAELEQDGEHEHRKSKAAHPLHLEEKKKLDAAKGHV